MGSSPSRPPPSTPCPKARSKSPARPVLSRTLSSSSSNSGSTIQYTPPSSTGTGSFVLLTPPASVKTSCAGSAHTPSCSGTITTTTKPRSQSLCCSDPDTEKIPPLMWQGQILPPKLREEPEPGTRVRDWFERNAESPSVASSSCSSSKSLLQNHQSENDGGQVTSSNCKPQRPHKNKRQQQQRQQHLRNRRRVLPSIPEEPHRFRDCDHASKEAIANLYCLVFFVISILLLPYLIAGPFTQPSLVPMSSRNRRRMAAPRASTLLQPNQLTIYVPVEVHYTKSSGIQLP